MDPLDALVRMRYRPSGDVLVGQVELVGLGAVAAAPDPGGPVAVAGEHDDRVEVLDADTMRTWRLVVSGPLRGRHLLAGFQVVGAAARLDSERAGLTELLPVSLARAATEMISAAAATAARLGVADRLRARAEVEVQVPLVELVGSHDEASGGLSATSAALADLGATRALAAALTHLADAVEAELAVRSIDRATDPVGHAERFVTAVRALAGIVSRHRLPAPGAATAAAQTVRGGLPLSGSERIVVRQALTDLDDVHQWRAVAGRLEALAAVLDDQRVRQPRRFR